MRQSRAAKLEAVLDKAERAIQVLEVEQEMYRRVDNSARGPSRE